MTVPIYSKSHKHNMKYIVKIKYKIFIILPCQGSKQLTNNSCDIKSCGRHSVVGPISTMRKLRQSRSKELAQEPTGQILLGLELNPRKRSSSAHLFPPGHLPLYIATYWKHLESPTTFQKELTQELQHLPKLRSIF